MSIGSFVSREVKFGEAALINLGANQLESGIAPVEAQIDAAAPQGVAAVISAVEKADAVLGIANAAVINGVLNAYQSDISAELASLLAAGEKYLPSVVAAMRAVASKLQLEALATK